MGDALAGALMGPAIGRCQSELIDLETTRRWTGRNEVEGENVRWVRWFIQERPHFAIDYRPPLEYEKMSRSDQATDPRAA